MVVCRCRNRQTLLRMRGPNEFRYLEVDCYKRDTSANLTMRLCPANGEAVKH